MRTSISFLCLAFSLIIVGAGCQPSSLSSVASSSQPPAAPSPVAAAPAKSVVSANKPSMPSTLAFPGILSARETANMRIRIKTLKGEIVFDLLPQEGPKAASNFVYLAKQKFYDGLTFHRIEPGFVVQGGDPMGNGIGGPGYKFEDDVVRLPYTEGIVAMANAGPNTNGSQFFIMLGDTPLPPKYSIFGRVVTGLEVVKKLERGDKMLTVRVEKK